MANLIGFANYAETTLAAAITSIQTTIAVTDASVFAATQEGAGYYFYLTLVDCTSSAANSDPPAQREIVKVTAVSGDVLTVVRGQDGTTAQAFAACDVAAMRFNAQSARDLRDTGGGGNPLTVEDEGTVVDSNVTVINFTGAGVTASETSAGVVEIHVPGGGSGGGTLQGEEFTTAGAFTFNVPTGVTSVWVTQSAAGGGGGAFASTAANGGGGGGAGEYCVSMPLLCTSGGTITGSVGAGGAGATGGSSANGAAGGDTTTGTIVTRGGLGGNGTTTSNSGAGGGPRGGAAVGGGGGGAGVGLIGAQESPNFYGGASGGSGATTTGTGGGAGGPCGGYPTGAAGGAAASTQAGGGAGASSIYGIGGTGGDGGVAGSAGVNPGSGGGGAGGKTSGQVAGGAGAHGYVLIQWVA